MTRIGKDFDRATAPKTFTVWRKQWSGRRGKREKVKNVFQFDYSLEQFMNSILFLSLSLCLIGKGEQLNDIYWNFSIVTRRTGGMSWAIYLSRVATAPCLDSASLNRLRSSRRPDFLRTNHLERRARERDLAELKWKKRS